MGPIDRFGLHSVGVKAGGESTVEINCYASVPGQIGLTVGNGFPQFGDIIYRHSVIIIMAKLHRRPFGVLEMVKHRLHNLPVWPTRACHQQRLGYIVQQVLKFLLIVVRQAFSDDD
jgi:hypothetical protein